MIEDIKISPEEFTKNKDSNEAETEYLQIETNDKAESNLAEIIGDREKGTLQVLIVGEDGKITNSEYIFKKEIFSDDELKGASDRFSRDNIDTDDENCNQCNESVDDKSNQTNSSSETPLCIHPNLNCREKMRKLECNLNLARKSINLLQTKCKNVRKQNKTLKLLLKLLVLKRGKGEKNVKQLLEEYERFECNEVDIKVKKEDLYVEN